MIPINQLLPLSAAWATPLESESYRSAVWRLTATYTIFVSILLGVFSVVVLQLFSITLKETSIGRLAATFPEASVNHELVEHLFSVIVYADIACFAIAFGLAYVLAKRTLRPLETSFLQQKQFVANTAHELRTPLSVMKAQSELLLQHNRTAIEYVAGIESMLEETDRLITLTNGLLFLASPHTLITAAADTFDLSALCTKQIIALMPYATRKGLKLESTIAPALRSRGRQSDIGQVLLNIVKNAVDYTPAPGTVALSLTAHGQLAELVITDTGIGMSAEALPHIFKRFYKADTARSEMGTRGAGLGLAIVSEILAAHQGAITVTSTVGVGSRFVVTLPLV